MFSLTDRNTLLHAQWPRSMEVQMTSTILTTSPSDSIDRVIDLMELHEIHHVPVVDGDRLVGMVSDRDILISTGWMFAIERGSGGKAVGPLRVSQIMTSPLHVLKESDDLPAAAGLMIAHKISAVPIVNESQLRGLVTDTDLIRCLMESACAGGAAQRFLDAKVKTLMSTPPITVTLGASLDEIVAVFRRFHLRHVAVAENQRVLGIISDRDVRRVLGWSAVRDMQADAEGRIMAVPMPQRASEIMKENLKTVGSEDSLGTALRTMQCGRIHSLPVVDNDKLIGILTQTDFVRAIAREPLL